MRAGWRCMASLLRLFGRSFQRQRDRLEQRHLLLEPIAWVGGIAVDVQTEMQMRSGGAAGGTDFSNLLSGFNVLSLFHQNFAQVQIERDHSLTVIDSHNVAVQTPSAVSKNNVPRLTRRYW